MKSIVRFPFFFYLKPCFHYMGELIELRSYDGAFTERPHLMLRRDHVPVGDHQGKPKVQPLDHVQDLLTCRPGAAIDEKLLELRASMNLCVCVSE